MHLIFSALEGTKLALKKYNSVHLIFSALEGTKLALKNYNRGFC